MNARDFIGAASMNRRHKRTVAWGMKTGQRGDTPSILNGSGFDFYPAFSHGVPQTVNPSHYRIGYRGNLFRYRFVPSEHSGD